MASEKLLAFITIAIVFWPDILDISTSNVATQTSLAFFVLSWTKLKAFWGILSASLSNLISSLMSSCFLMITFRFLANPPI